MRGGHLGVAVARDGRVLSYTGSSSRGGTLTAAHTISAADALRRVAEALAPGISFTPELAGEVAGFQSFARGPFAASSYVRKAAFPSSDGGRPAYRVLFVKSWDQAWDVVIDRATGSTLYRSSLVAHDAEGTVYPYYQGATRGSSTLRLVLGGAIPWHRLVCRAAGWTLMSSVLDAFEEKRRVELATRRPVRGRRGQRTSDDPEELDLGPVPSVEPPDEVVASFAQGDGPIEHRRLDELAGIVLVDATRATRDASRSSVLLGRKECLWSMPGRRSGRPPGCWPTSTGHVIWAAG